VARESVRTTMNWAARQPARNALGHGPSRLPSTGAGSPAQRQSSEMLWTRTVPRLPHPKLSILSNWKSRLKPNGKVPKCC